MIKFGINPINKNTIYKIVSLIFLFVYFWNERFSKTILYIVFLLIGFIPNLIIDFYFLGAPGYTLIRHFGSQFIISLGLNPTTSDFHLFETIKNNLEILLIPIIISPLLYKLYKFDFLKYKKDSVFLFLTLLILIVRASLLKYLLIISPLAVLFLSKVFNKKDILIHAIVSILLIVLLTSGYFTDNQSSLLSKDLIQIKEDFSPDYIISESYETNVFGALSWENKPFYVWEQDYLSHINNESFTRSYNFEINPKIPVKDALDIRVSFKGAPVTDYAREKIIFVSEDEKEIESFKLRKCYSVLCAYERVI
jgi:hypothetical protein